MTPEKGQNWNLDIGVFEWLNVYQCNLVWMLMVSVVIGEDY